VFADMNLETAKASSEQSKKYATNKGYETTTFEMNVEDDKSVQNMVDFVVQEFGRIDYAVNAAGASDASSLINEDSGTDACALCRRSIMVSMRLLPIPMSTILIASCT
jgi:NAD(P)-dependent dehydrogenase (short-subunit alcohol dehydrogenase family)